MLLRAIYSAMCSSKYFPKIYVELFACKCIILKYRAVVVNLGVVVIVVSYTVIVKLTTQSKTVTKINIIIMFRNKSAFLKYAMCNFVNLCGMCVSTNNANNLSCNQNLA